MSEKIFYAEHFYNKVSKDSEALKKNADDFPFSSLAGFLLLYHYKKTSHPDYEKMAKKMALLFNNQYWLQFQLHNEPLQNNNNQELVNVAIEEKLPADDIKLYNEQADSFKQNFIEEPIQELTLQNDNASDVEKDDGKVIENEVQVIDTNSDILEHNIEHRNESGTAEISVNNIEESSIENTKIIEDKLEGKAETIAFEPLHTVDYFASQGIKISEELLQNDKLGSQMKSFTEWLRSMKKLHPSKLAEQGLATEKLIQQASNESNINTEILTEAMAEVLIKQDKKEKAIEMFSKLSLINPSKSAYFAARIESIKST